jgi:coenzyme F420-reducing hydrogenase alpha subunit
MEVIGGRAVHPINVAVGGFHRAPAAAAIRGLVPELEWGLAAAEALVREVSRFAVPDFSCDHEYVALRPADGYTPTAGRIVSSRGLDIAVDEYPAHFAERQVPHSTALASGLLPDMRPYLTGALARINTSADRLPEPARRALDESGLTLPVTNSFRSIVVRAIELVAAFAEAVAIARSAAADIAPCRIPFVPRAGTGSHATEAPRGLLYHRYTLGDDGLVTEATIVPPTAQNQAAIETELRGILPTALALDDAAAALRCEQLIRNHDPCISCATHFLTLSIERG